MSRRRRTKPCPTAGRAKAGTRRRIGCPRDGLAAAGVPARDPGGSNFFQDSRLHGPLGDRSRSASRAESGKNFVSYGKRFPGTGMPGVKSLSTSTSLEADRDVADDQTGEGGHDQDTCPSCVRQPGPQNVVPASHAVSLRIQGSNPRLLRRSKTVERLPPKGASDPSPRSGSRARSDPHLSRPRPTLHAAGRAESYGGTRTEACSGSSRMHDGRSLRREG